MPVFELIALAVLAFYFSILTTVLILIKKHIYFLYIWQWKEYRLDKFLDLVTSPKFSAVFLDWFTKCRIFALLILLLNIILGFLNTDYLLITYLFIIGISILELAIFARQIIQKRALLPKFSFKLLGISGLAVLFNIVGLLSIAVLSLRFYSSGFILALLISLLVATLATPLVTGVSILALFPLDYLLKERIFRKAKAYRQKLHNLKVVGISGSYGKSSTKEILSFLLSSKFKTEKTFQNHNSTLAVARKILNLEADADIFISEIGAYHQGDGIEQCQFSLPNTAIITGLNNQHFALFGGKNQIIAAESESLQFLKAGDFAIINYESPWCKEINIPEGIKLIKYGFSPEADLRAEIIKMDVSGTVFQVFWENQSHTFATNLTTAGNVQNILAALACCLVYGFNLQEMTDLLTNLPLPNGTLNIIEKKYGYIIDDSHNANLDGVLNSLNLVQSFDGKKIVFLDDIAELGNEAVKSHIAIAESLNKINLDLLILVGQNYSQIIADRLLELGFDTNKIIYGSLGGKLIQARFDQVIGPDWVTANQAGSKTGTEIVKTVILYQGFGTRKFVG